MPSLHFLLAQLALARSFDAGEKPDTCPSLRSVLLSNSKRDSASSEVPADKPKKGARKSKAAAKPGRANAKGSKGKATEPEREAKAFYVLNPSGDLVNTQKRFEEKFQQLEETKGWQGLTNCKPTKDQVIPKNTTRGPMNMPGITRRPPFACSTWRRFRRTTSSCTSDTAVVNKYGGALPATCLHNTHIPRNCARTPSPVSLDGRRDEVARPSPCLKAGW